jgi:hypothetical protein
LTFTSISPGAAHTCGSFCGFTATSQWTLIERFM